jgi:hypothetical protein
MTDSVTVHTSTRIVAGPPPVPFEWKAEAEDGDRHAFPQRNGFPPPAACGVRWTTRFGHAGASWCGGCVAELRAQLLNAAVALAPVEAQELGAGDHYAGMAK